MGIYYKEQKRLEKSIKFFNKGIKLQKTLPNEDMRANLFHNMSGSYGLMGEIDKRLVYLAQTESQTLQTQAQEIAQRLGLNYLYRFTGYGALPPALSDLTASA